MYPNITREFVNQNKCDCDKCKQALDSGEDMYDIVEKSSDVTHKVCAYMYSLIKKRIVYSNNPNVTMEFSCDRCNQLLSSCQFITWCKTCNFKNCSKCNSTCSKYKCTNCCEHDEHTIECPNCHTYVCTDCINWCKICEFGLNCTRCHRIAYDESFQYCDSNSNPECSKVVSNIKTIVDTMKEENNWNWSNPDYPDDEDRVLNCVYKIGIKCALESLYIYR